MEQGHGVASQARPGMGRYLQPPRCSFVTVVVGSISLFRLFGEARLTDGNVTLEDYPRPRLRSVMIQQAAQRVPRPQGLDTHPAFVGDEVHKIPTMKAGQLDVERMFSQLTGQPEATEGLDDAWGEVGKSQMYRLQDYWRTKLKWELLEFAHKPLSSYGDSGEEATGEGS